MKSKNIEKKVFAARAFFAKIDSVQCSRSLFLPQFLSEKRFTLFKNCSIAMISVVLAAIIIAMILWPKPPEINPSSHALSYCGRELFEAKSYIVCRADPRRDDIRLFLHDEQGRAYKRFAPLNVALAKRQETLAFAMNAGMYHADYSAVGLYIEKGQESHAISTRQGPGNFHMLPNGVFYLDEGKAGVLDTQSYLTAAIRPFFATQSGPMLVIDNQIHPRFIVNSPFLEYRNGVGVTEAGTVMFVISESKVNFDEMARFFRDRLVTPNALFLDGSISSLYAPEIDRADWFYPMGPIIGVVIKTTEDTTQTTP